MTRSPDLPKPLQAVALGPAAPWAGSGQKTVRRHRTAMAMLAGLMLLVSAIWAVPPLLDWGRFRGTIAAIAAARLGRPVSIGGEVTLRLLPRAVLTAADVTLPDQGDGVSARIASLRLEVALIPLLTGRLAPRDLVLGTPVLRIPWPLPETLAAPSRPRVPRAFAAHLDNGTLVVGGARIDGITAALHSGPDGPAGFGAAPPELGAQGFGAEGFAAFAGRSWRFTSALGAPDADGVSALDLSVSGQGQAARTDATVQGTLSERILQGRLVAGGPDLSLLLPAAPLAWRAEAGFVADGARITAPSLSLSLGGSPADGAFTLGLTRPARLQGRLHAANIDLDGWVGNLPARFAASRTALPPLRGEVTLSADQAKLLGGSLTGVRATAALNGSSLALRNGAAGLPGQAQLTISGAVTARDDGLHLNGPATLDAPSLRTTLAWLRPLAPALADALPAGVLAKASLAGTVELGPHNASVSDLSGEVDGSEVAGGLGADLGPHPHLGLGLKLSRLTLDHWLGTLWPPQSPGLAGLGRVAAGLATDIHIRADTATWRAHIAGGLVLDGQTGPGGLAVRTAMFDTDGAHVVVRGSVATDGTVSGGAVQVIASGGAGLAPWWPDSWRWAAPAWQGAASLNAALAGPANDLAVQLRADSGDLVLEADGRIDSDAGRAAGSLTLRHPGAPRLLAALGVPAAEQWLGTGSLALRAQVGITPARIVVEDFDLRAADLGLGGHLALDRSAAEPSWTGALIATHLAIPDLKQITAASLERAGEWTVDIDMKAAELGVGGRTVAHDVGGTLSLAHGAGLLDVSHADAIGGQANGQIAFDLGRGRQALAARAWLIGADAAQLAPGLPVDVRTGRADIQADLANDAEAKWPGGLSGQADIALRDLTLTGFDLIKIGDALAQHGSAARVALAHALSQGETAGLSGTLAATFAHNRAVLAAGRLTSEDGEVDVTGSADLAARSVDLLFGLQPDGVAVPGIGVRVTGPWMAARAQPLAGQPAPHPRHARTR